METSSYNISQYCNTNTRYKTNKNILWTNHRLLGSINGKRRQTVWPRDKFPSDCAPRFQNSLSKRILSTISTAFYCLDCCLPRKFIEESYRVKSRLIGKSSIERSRENDKGKLCVMSRRGRYRARRTLKTSWKLHQLDRRKVLFFLLVEESRSRRTRQRSHSRQPTTPLQRSFAFCCFVCSVSSSLSLSLSLIEGEKLWKKSVELASRWFIWMTALSRDHLTCFSSGFLLMSHYRCLFRLRNS